ncbi:hypothetical protein [Bacillus sp. ISL-77]|uniref:hypothetical protein n=1 Tax=Bacillus sp. ISL-77 TaxID=2819138 RepID=UPI001BE8158E|nr:hypothetical protein [Bacillus sp. ISL-77]MBT2740556.1 hypothetical protein [Bacillus sp. ISL-77]
MSGKIIQRGKITIMTYRRTDGKYEAIISDHKHKKTVKRQGDTEESAILKATAALKISDIQNEKPR